MYSKEVMEKTVILYTLYKFNLSMTSEHLYIVFIENDILDYFTYMERLMVLVEDKFASTISIEGENRYGITEKGREFVEMSLKEIPYKIKRKINAAVVQILEGYSKLTDVRATTSAINENRFVVKCGVYERNVPLMEVNITSGSRKHVEKLAKTFRTKNEEIYKKVFEIFENEE